MGNISEKMHSTIDKYEAKDFSFFFKSLDGFSEEQLGQHYSLYEKYVAKVNEIHDKLKIADRKSANHNYSQHRGLIIDLSHNLNGVLLHELYFSNMTDKITECSSSLMQMIQRDFENWDSYMEDFRATGMDARSGWAITAYNYRDGRLHNFAIDQHDIHVPVFVRPLLIMDTWEHSFSVDYGIDKASYIDSFLKVINWHVVSLRLESALKIEPEH